MSAKVSEPYKQNKGGKMDKKWKMFKLMEQKGYFECILWLWDVFYQMKVSKEDFLNIKTF